MLQVRFEVSMDATEIAAGGIPGDFINLIDSDTGIHIGVKYDRPNNQFILYESGVSNTLDIPHLMPANTLAALVLNISPVSSPNTPPPLRINTYVGGSFTGALITQQGININSMKVGVLQHSGTLTINRLIQNIGVGSNPGQSDVFSDGGYADNTIVPPFDSTSGATLAIVGGALKITKSIAGDTFAEVALSVPGGAQRLVIIRIPRANDGT